MHLISSNWQLRRVAKEYIGWHIMDWMVGMDGGSLIHMNLQKESGDALTDGQPEGGVRYRASREMDSCQSCSDQIPHESNVRLRGA